ncbi:hypothetical protein PX699_01690 [Sphingobium sp. H39-3-25]|uniref:hypothetical protein n=1 Tax=Sphingobium arseniciresistens TaxID=3030834 RepID=UPI0023B8F527|nr:hypothetical protein [Sphingobium arseniciresistens]
MFSVISAFVFVTAFSLAVGTIAYMLHAYKEKMIAALLVEPIPHKVRETHVAVQRFRGGPASTPAPMRRRQRLPMAGRAPMAVAA